MRVKTDERRTAIVRSAWKAFAENGFDRTSMSEISSQLGGSKATLYSYFKSKEELFAAALQDACEEKVAPLFDRLTAAGPLLKRLMEFGVSYLTLKLEDETIAIHRLLVSESEREDLCRRVQTEFFQPQWRRFGAVLEEAMRRGELRPAEGYVAAIHFKNLIEGDLLDRRLFGDPDVCKPQTVKTTVKVGVEAFLRAYAPE